MMIVRHFINAYIINARMLSVMVIQHKHKLPQPLKKFKKANISAS